LITLKVLKTEEGKRKETYGDKGEKDMKKIDEQTIAKCQFLRKQERYVDINAIVKS
jgi:hypothetical protein